MKVLFFGRLREQIGTTSLDIIENPNTVADLIALLKKRDKSWFDAFDDNDVLAAVNQTLCDEKYVLTSSDEVAFFPPVTGG